MKKSIEERTEEIAVFIDEKGATVRSAAKAFGISKSTVHKDISTRLEKINPELFERVRKILDLNKAQRHLRGGIATKEKYKNKCDMTKPHNQNAANAS